LRSTIFRARTTCRRRRRASLAARASSTGTASGPIEERRAGIGGERGHARVVVEPDAHVELRACEPEVREPCGAHLHPVLARVLQDDDARARRARHEVDAETERRRTAAAAAARHGDGRTIR
jgi:hypothetical protein